MCRPRNDVTESIHTFIWFERAYSQLNKFQQIHWQIFDQILLFLLHEIWSNSFQEEFTILTSFTSTVILRCLTLKYDVFLVQSFHTSDSRLFYHCSSAHDYKIQQVLWYYTINNVLHSIFFLLRPTFPKAQYLSC